MLTVTEAEKILLSNLPQWKNKKVHVSDSLGCVLQENIIASRPQPPFDRATMDGIAIAFGDYQRGLRQFHLQGVVLAGDAIQKLKYENCFQIMTGAVVPESADCVVPIEQVVIDETQATITSDAVKQGQFIHAMGTDYKKGQTLLTPGTRIGSPELGCILTSGIQYLSVAHDPRITIITTGNELVKTGEAIQPHQIYATNDAVLSALLKQHGFSNSHCRHANDSVEILTNVLSRALQESDVLIITGGVSMGKTDFVPSVLHQLGVEKLFHKIAQRPGKPMWFGRKNDKLVFGLPGNPVSAYVCLRRYVIPALQHIQHTNMIKKTRVYLTESISPSASLTFFIPTICHQSDDNRTQAKLKLTNTSGDFFSLVGTDGMVELPLGITDFPKGSEVNFYSWI